MDLDLFFMLPYGGGAVLVGLCLVVFERTRWLGAFLLAMGAASAVLSAIGAFLGMLVGANVSTALHLTDMRRNLVIASYWLGMAGGALTGATFAGVAIWNSFVRWSHMMEAAQAASHEAA